MSDPLDDLRQEIDDIDDAILELVIKRLRAVLAVGDHKRARGIPVYDPERERRLLERLCAKATAPADPAAVKRIFERLVDESRRAEQHHVSKAQ